MQLVDGDDRPARVAGLAQDLDPIHQSLGAGEGGGGQGCDGKKRDDSSSVVVVTDGWGQTFLFFFRVAQTSVVPLGLFFKCHVRGEGGHTQNGFLVHACTSKRHQYKVPHRHPLSDGRSSIWVHCHSPISWEYRRLKQLKQMPSKTTGSASPTAFGARRMLRSLCAATGIPKSQRRVESSPLRIRRETRRCCLAQNVGSYEYPRESVAKKEQFNSHKSRQNDSSGTTTATAAAAVEATAAAAAAAAAVAALTSSMGVRSMYRRTALAAR